MRNQCRPAWLAKALLLGGVCLAVIGFVFYALGLTLTDMPWDSIMSGINGEYFVVRGPLPPGVVQAQQMEPISRHRFETRANLELACNACLFLGAISVIAALVSFVLSRMARPNWWPLFRNQFFKWLFWFITSSGIIGVVIAIGIGVLAPKAAGLPENMIRIRHHGGTYITGRAGGPMQQRTLIPITLEQWKTCEQWESISTVIGVVSGTFMFALGLWVVSRAICAGYCWGSEGRGDIQQ